jgi:hypothetical protein
MVQMLPVLSRADLAKTFKDPRTLLAFDAFQRQLATALPADISGLQSLNFVLTQPDLVNAPNGHVVTAGTGISISASVGTVTYSVISAPKWTSPRTLSFTGDAAGTLASVDGSANVAGTLTLSIVNTAPGTYALASLTVDNKGRVTAASAASTTGTGSVVLAASPTITTPAIVGVTSGANAAAGDVGEYTSSSVSAVAITSNVATNITSLSLGAGIWRLNGYLEPAVSAGATVSLIILSISTGSAAIQGSPGRAVSQVALPVGCTMSLDAERRVNLSAPATLYLVGAAAYSGGAVTMNGFLGATRIL